MRTDWVPVDSDITAQPADSDAKRSSIPELEDQISVEPMKSL